MTQYYVDADNGNNANTGLGTSGALAWADIDQFTENARSAGDICTVRRGNTADIGDGTNLTFTSDGTPENPIILEADYDNNWSDDVTTAGETYTTTFGSKTITASATPDAAIVAGTWVYVSTDDPRESAYEVASVVSNDITLHLPFKGTAGSGLTLVVMKANPIWGTASAAFQWQHTSDFFWVFRGFHVRGDVSSGAMDLNASAYIKDCIAEGDSATPAGACFALSGGIFADNCRSINGTYGFDFSDCHAVMRNCLTDGNASIDDTRNTRATVRWFESEFLGNYGMNGSTQSNSHSEDLFSNCQFNTIDGSPSLFALVGSSDHDGTPGNSVAWRRQAQSGVTLTDFITEETTTVRSGGSNTSMKITPGSTAEIADNPLGRVKLMEKAFYATTASKQYDIYFRPTLTTDWTADPTASELWIELEAWGHATNNFRKITKSTGVIDMNGSTAWQALSVTVAPAQAGVAFLRVWYAKPVEASKANSFFIDPIPVIT